jgi:3-phosphoglycerate kinase
MIKYIDEVTNLKGVKVLLRLDLNVPIVDGKVTDPYRMERSLQTIDFLRHNEAQTIIIAHCEGKESSTLLPMWDYLKGFLPIDFCPTFFTPDAIDKLLKMQNGGVLLFENLRINDGEKSNDPEFAKKLAQMADIYVNDAFSVSHRKHASIVGLPQIMPHYGGLLLREEIENLSKVFSPEHPFIFFLAGAKFETKLPLIKKYLDVADKVFVGGALASDIFKAKGFEIGKSLASDSSAGDFGIPELLKNPKLIFPTDVTVTGADDSVAFKKQNEITTDEIIVDAGPETIVELKNILNGSSIGNSPKTIVWNGPLGNFEKGFGDKTEQLAELIADATVKGARSIVGGGDTLSSIRKLGLEEKFSFVSTGGGAMLDFLVNETLPGIEALQDK